MKNEFTGKNILVTGGTGSIGRELVKTLLMCNPSVIRILDMDETEQFEMEHDFSGNAKLRFLIGDVRDRERLRSAMEDIDIVFHLAALKHVKSCEYNPFESVKTNVIGTQNVIDAALEKNVKKVVFTSTDKAANPDNTMGASKLLAERLITAANYYKGKKSTLFSSVRFGNVMGSRGSVIPLFINQIKKGGPVTITKKDMTRFMMSSSQAVGLILKCAELTKGGEVFILKMPVVRLIDLAECIIEDQCKKHGKNPADMKITEIGMKPGETMYEELMTESESVRAYETDELFIIPPAIGEEMTGEHISYSGSIIKTPHRYDSRDQKTLGKDEVKSILKKEGLI